MKAATTRLTVTDRVDELQGVLDKDIQHIQQTLSRLDELRSLVIKRNDASLAKLLDELEVESGSYKINELKRQSIRKELADALDCTPEQMTLSRLEEILPEEKKDQVTEKKAKLKALIKELKKKHLSTTLLLSDCARVNSLLLKGILGIGGTGTVYYNSNGSTKQQTDTTLVNLHF